MIRETATYQDYKRDLEKILDKVAYAHWPGEFTLDGNHHFVDRFGNPVAEASTRRKENRERDRQERAERREEVGKESTRNIKDSERYAKPIRLIKDLIADNAMQIAQAMIDVAVGAKVIRKDDQGNEIGVYDKLPDVKAATDLLTRIMGKPTEYKEVEINSNVNKKVTIYIPDNGRNVAGAAPVPKMMELPDGNIVESSFVDEDPQETPSTSPEEFASASASMDENEVRA